MASNNLGGHGRWSKHTGNAAQRDYSVAAASQFWSARTEGPQKGGAYPPHTPLKWVGLPTTDGMAGHDGEDLAIEDLRGIGDVEGEVECTAGAHGRAVAGTGSPGA